MGLFTIWLEEDGSDKDNICGSFIDSECCEPAADTNEAHKEIAHTNSNLKSI